MSENDFYGVRSWTLLSSSFVVRRSPFVVDVRRSSFVVVVVVSTSHKTMESKIQSLVRSLLPRLLACVRACVLSWADIVVAGCPPASYLSVVAM